jgi:ectoine hydroxylase-related dioxygenase (phytanoyl-CoA dioxygenase family)
MGKMLSQADVDRFGREGFLFPHRVMSAADAQSYRSKLEGAEAELGGPLPALFRQKSHLLFTWAAELVRHPAILDYVEDLIGPDILCWSSSFFNKEPHSKDFVSWHQDATYWGLSGHEVVTAWLAFAPSTVESGCMEVIPGSHRQQVQHRDTFAPNNLLSRGQEIAVQVDPAKSVKLILQPGEISLHHVLIFHYSAENRSPDRRIGYAIRYMPPHVHQVVGERDSATLVRGRDEHGYFDLEPAPLHDLDPDMVAFHKSVSDRQAKVLYRGTHKTTFG